MAATTASASEQKSEFENTSGGYLGAVVIVDGKQQGISVEPGQMVWLSEAEQILTANAPRDDSDNPFTNGGLTLRTEATQVKNRRPLGDQQSLAAEEPEPAGDPEPAVAEVGEPVAHPAPATQPPGPPTPPRQGADEAAAKAEAERLAAGQRQANAGVVPVPEEKAIAGDGKAEEHGVEVEPVGDAPKGERAVKEEVGTPGAEPKPETKKA